MNNAIEARRLLRAHRYGALSTLSKKLEGFPFGSITPYLVDQDGSLLILISALAEHTRNIRHDPRVSLITHNQGDANIQMQGRVTVVGHAHPVTDPEQCGTRYLRHFPEAASYLSMADFAFYRIQPLSIRYIAGVGRIHWVRMEDYSATQAASLTRHEEELLNTINLLHKDILQEIIRQQHDAEATDVQATGVDCDGLDVRTAEQFWRLDFTETLTDSAQLAPITELRRHFTST